MSASFRDPKSDKIKHVIVLALENRSFDQMLGGLQTEMPDLDGVMPNAPLRRNSTLDDFVFEQNKIYDKQIGADPKHEHENVMNQLADNNSGFIKDFVKAYPNSTSTDRLHLMGFYPAGYLPALHTLARHFAVCDRWHSSLPGPTWPNRNFLLSGTTLGKIKMPEGFKNLDMALGQNQDTIFDRLNEAGRSWKAYFHDLPCSWILCHQQRKENRARYFDFARFAEDAMDEAAFPEFSFIEPKYYGENQNDDHPPHNVMKAQKLIADIYNSIRKNPKLWESTLFVIVYDEHGGFFDHVVPPTAVPPGSYANSEYAFDQLGVRVPALLVSPWVKPGVEHTLFDHTSVLRYLIDKWQLNELGERARSANSIECALQFDSPVTTAPEKIEVTEAQLETPRPELEDDSLSDHHQALIHLSSIVKNALVNEAVGDLALLGRDPPAFKRRVYPWLDLLGKALTAMGLKDSGSRLSRLHTDFLHEELERTSAGVKAAISVAQSTDAIKANPENAASSPGFNQDNKAPVSPNEEAQK